MENLSQRRIALIIRFGSLSLQIGRYDNELIGRSSYNTGRKRGAGL